MNRSDLERARASAPITSLSLEGLALRRERKEARRRLGALIVVATIGVLAVGGAFAVYDGTGSSARTPGDTDPKAWTMPPGLAIPAGSYAYVHRVVYGDVEAYEYQSWFSPSDGSGRVRETGTASDEPLDSGVPGEQILYVHDQMYTSGEMTSGDVPNMDPLDGLSTDPDVLVGQLIGRSRPGGASPIPPPTSGPNAAASTSQVVSVIDVLLVRANATPELKAALSQVLAGLEGEGVTVTSATMDPVGRPAWSASFASHATSETWWFDPQSDQLLVHKEHSQAARVTFFTVYEASGVVSGTHAIDAAPSFIPPTTATP